MSVDDTDRGILYLLQRDARRITTEEVGVSASTVRNRIEKMEESGVIRGYYPDINYDKAGLQLYVEFICTAPNPERGRLAKEARDINGVVAIREVLNGDKNIQIDAVGTDPQDVARINDELSKLGLSVNNTKIIKETFMQPFNHFGEDVVKDDQNG
jgi:Lrp/AsnC family leucine-responsive transcriptional regulator